MFAGCPAENTMTQSPSLLVISVAVMMLTMTPTLASINLARVPCGISSKGRNLRVIGGKPASPGQFPWTARKHQMCTRVF